MEKAPVVTVFSGIWEQSNSKLMSNVNQLAKLAKSEFDIDISIDKMMAEEDYRQLVISELTELSNPEINKITAWLLITDKSTPTREINNTHLTKKQYGLLLSLTVLSIAACFFWFSSNAEHRLPTEMEVSSSISSVVESNKPAVKEELSATQLVRSNLSNSKPIKTTPIKSKTVFRLHGSNTIGEKLAPMLLEGFLETKGINNYTWTNKKPLERVLHYSVGQQNYAIELFAHGSSTAFSALNNKTADIGMSSRRIKNKEVKGLTNNVGNLSKVGNEHIIGLDGLAVIVNQNNTVNQLSSKTLAKIFSGEVNNWSQLGGISLPIKLYARDQHSGTWDTFKNLVLKKHDKKLSQQAQRFESSSELSTLVSQHEGAIGFIGLNYVLHNKALAIAASKEANAIFPTRFTVGTEDYALARRLYFYTPTTASNLIKDFAQYALSTPGQEVVAKAGLISQNIKLEKVYPLDTSPKKYKEYAKTAQRLSLNFRFDYATKDLDNKGKRDLQRLVGFMEKHQSRRIVLMGFSDSIGAKTKNSDLSFKRAKSVELALSSRGIPVLAVEAMGEALPIANNNTEAGRKRNRRVEVWLL
jgi:phosphate transport system substrate-binding protein